MARDPLGVTGELIASGQAEEAIELCSALVAVGRGGVLVRVALADALLAVGRGAEAVTSLQDTCLLAPDSADATAALGRALEACGDVPGAIASFQRAVRLDPDNGALHGQLARLWLEAGEADKAAAEAMVAMNLGAISETEAAAMHDDIRALRDATRSPAGYVRQLFNQFAGDYDIRMRGKLGYAAPDVLRSLANLLLEPGRLHDVVDLGCGTGLSGLAFKPIARRMVGVDLSPRMLERAGALGIYDELIEADIGTAAIGMGGQFDLAVAADVLVYFGAIEGLFGAVHRALKPDGVWFFSTERSDGADFELGPKRRYRHSDAYLRRVAAELGFDVLSLIECVSRYEAGEPVASWGVAVRRR